MGFSIYSPIKIKPRFNVSMFLVLATVFLDYFAGSLIIPLLRDFTKAFGASEFEHGFIFISYPVAQMISSLAMGYLSDKYGRKPLLIWSIIGSSFGHLFQALCKDKWTFLVARFLTGCLGGSLTVSLAYVTDCVSQAKRPAWHSRIYAVTSISWIIGPVVSSAVISVDLTFPLYLAFGVGFIILVASEIFLSDSKEFLFHDSNKNDDENKIKNDNEPVQVVSINNPDNIVDNNKDNTNNNDLNKDINKDIINTNEVDIDMKSVREDECESCKTPIHNGKSSSEKDSKDILQEDKSNLNIKDIIEIENNPDNLNNFENKGNNNDNKEISNDNKEISNDNKEISNDNKQINKLKPYEDPYVIKNFKYILMFDLISSFLNWAALTGLDLLYPLYAADVAHHNSTIVGFVFSAQSVIMGFDMFFFITYLHNYISYTYYFIIFPPLTLIWYIIAVIFFKNGILVAVFQVFVAFSISPIITVGTSVISILVSEDKQGYYMSFTNIADALSKILVPLLHSYLYGLDPIYPFYLMLGLNGLLLITSFILFLFIRPIKAFDIRYSEEK